MYIVNLYKIQHNKTISFNYYYLSKIPFVTQRKRNYDFLQLCLFTRKPTSRRNKSFIRFAIDNPQQAGKRQAPVYFGSWHPTRSEPSTTEPHRTALLALQMVDLYHRQCNNSSASRNKYDYYSLLIPKTFISKCLRYNSADGLLTTN